jgi:hypothetical protein
METSSFLTLLSSGLFSLGALALFRIPGIGIFGGEEGSGNVIRKKVDVRDFNRVKLSGIGNLFIEQTGEESLEVEIEDNLYELLRIVVNSQELSIGFIPNIGFIRPTKAINFYLKVKDIQGITLSGSGEVDAGNLKGARLDIKVSGSGDIETEKLEAQQLSLTISGSGNIKTSDILTNEFSTHITGHGDARIPTLKTDEMELKISGSGKFEIDKVETKSIEARITGVGNMRLAGKTGSQEIVISGSGNYRAAELESTNATIKISGVGDANVKVSDNLDVSISGSGSVRYTGRPSMQVRKSGIGKVTSVENKIS